MVDHSDHVNKDHAIYVRQADRYLRHTFTFIQVEDLKRDALLRNLVRHVTNASKPTSLVHSKKLLRKGKGSHHRLSRIKIYSLVRLLLHNPSQVQSGIGSGVLNHRRTNQLVHLTRLILHLIYPQICPLYPTYSRLWI